MAKVIHVSSARWTRNKRHCSNCGAEILEYEAYKYSEPRNRPKLLWCYRCTPRRSQISSSKMGPVWDALDTLDLENLTTIEAVKEAAEGIRAEAESVRDEYQEGLDNMPAGLQEGPTGNESEEKIQGLDDLIQNLESAVEEEDPEDERPIIEMDALRTMLVEEGVDPDPLEEQIGDPIARHNLLMEHDLDFTAFETEVENQMRQKENEVLSGMKERVLEAAQGFEY